MKMVTITLLSMYAGCATLKYPVTLAVQLMYGNFTTTPQIIFTTIHVDSGAGVAVVVEDIHDGSIFNNSQYLLEIEYS